MTNYTNWLSMFDSVIDFQLIQMNKMRAIAMNQTSNFIRNISLTAAQQKIFASAFPLFISNLDDFILFLLNQFGTQPNVILHDTDNLSISVSQVNSTFNCTDFFED